MVRKRAIYFAVCIAATGGLVMSAANYLPTQVPTTLIDFFQPGSQPNGDLYEEFVSSNNCMACHEIAFDDADLFIYSSWQGSMMAQAARDPLFMASLVIANQDADFAGDLCIRCHSPGGWISGRSEPTDGSALTAVDRDGVSCSVCHRMVDPVFNPVTSPPVDEEILAGIDALPLSPGGGSYVLDSLDRRRGPYNDPVPPGHLWNQAGFFNTSELCGTCHDVSNPVFLRQPDGTYAVTPLDEPHPTGNKHDMFPVERTFSEWLHSEFAKTGVDMGGRFGGTIPGGVVSTCEDCHMPALTGRGCVDPAAALRDDLAAHEFAGGNAWVQDMVLNLYPNDNINPDNIEAGQAAAVSMLQRASTLEVTQAGHFLDVRIINETGHKLPSGYPEGRRMWLNVRQFDAGGKLIGELGYYNPLSAELTVADTKVYEAQLGVDQAISDATGIPVGESFHFAVNNVVLKDNRIPPRGFTNAAYQAIGASPVAVVYADGEYWDDTRFRLLPAATSVAVSLLYQTTSKEYVTFLRDANNTNDAGDVLFAQWELTGKSPPVRMVDEVSALAPRADGDFDADGDVDLFDFSAFLDCVSGPGGGVSPPGCAVFDFDEDDDVDLGDAGLLQFLTAP